jgi:hypothetical protein
MSHIVTIQVEVKDFDAIRSACHRLNLKEPVHGKARLYQTKVEGIIVELPRWTYPVICIPETGEVKYDNFEGEWGDVVHLHKFVQMYGVEKATLEARRKGYSVVEQPLVDGSIKLTVNMGGAA